MHLLAKHTFYLNEKFILPYIEDIITLFSQVDNFKGERKRYDMLDSLLILATKDSFPREIIETKLAFLGDNLKAKIIESLGRINCLFDPNAVVEGKKIEDYFIEYNDKGEQQRLHPDHIRLKAENLLLSALNLYFTSPPSQLTPAYEKIALALKQLLSKGPQSYFGSGTEETQHFMRLKENADVKSTRLTEKSSSVNKLNLSLLFLKDFNFKGLEFLNLNFEFTNLEKANFEGGKLVSCHFGGANLKGANFTGVSFCCDCTFRGADVSEAIFINTEISKEEPRYFSLTSFGWVQTACGSQDYYRKPEDIKRRLAELGAKNVDKAIFLMLDSNNLPSPNSSFFLRPLLPSNLGTNRFTILLNPS